MKICRTKYRPRKEPTPSDVGTPAQGMDRADAEVRLSGWAADNKVGDNMTWVGRDYSLKQAKADVRALLQSTPSQGGSPLGWRLVPPEATDDMVANIRKTQLEVRQSLGRDPVMDDRWVYRAMIAAAPTAPACDLAAALIREHWNNDAVRNSPSFQALLHFASARNKPAERKLNATDGTGWAELDRTLPPLRESHEIGSDS